MREGKRRFWTLLMLMLLALSGCDDGSVRGALVWEGAHVYDAGDTVQGQLVVPSGEVLIQEGAQVAGSVYILGGEVTIAGTVDEDVTIIAGDLVLNTTAVIADDLSLGGGTVERVSGAVFRGEVLGESDVQVNLETFFPQRTARQRLLRLLPQALTAALAYLTARLLGGPVVRVSRTTREHPVVAEAMGALF